MYVRKVKKAGKVYSYYYKSKRVGDKVKSIYVGRALDNKIEKPDVNKYEKNKLSHKEAINNLLEFDNLLHEINKLINGKDLNNAIFAYNRMFEIYNKLEISSEDRLKVFEKLNDIYKNLSDLGKESKIDLG